MRHHEVGVEEACPGCVSRCCLLNVRTCTRTRTSRLAERRRERIAPPWLCLTDAPAARGSRRGWEHGAGASARAGVRQCTHACVVERDIMARLGAAVLLGLLDALGVPSAVGPGPDRCHSLGRVVRRSCNGARRAYRSSDDEALEPASTTTACPSSRKLKPTAASWSMVTAPP